MENLIEKIQSSVLELPDRIKPLTHILSLLDLTTLEGKDNQLRIDQLCSKAMSFSSKGFRNPAAVCVYPPFVHQCKTRLYDTGIKVAAVAGAFPSGQLPLHLRVEECKYAVAEGADEIDMVISRGAFLEGKTEVLTTEVSAMKKACGNAHLKVILETGELETPENIKLASELAIAAGADFIKTSTGKIMPAATPEAMLVMLSVIRSHYDKTGQAIGIKPAGGISTPDQALLYYAMVKEICGEKWLDNSLFRIGASRLADAIVDELTNA